jgi:hypothetical protein
MANSVLVRISDGQPVAICDRLPSGKIVDAAFARSAEAIDANREWNLVNAFRCKVSNAKSIVANAELPIAVAINGGTDEFFI